MVFTGRTHAIKRVQFGILGPDEIRNMSVTQKTNARERAVDAGISKYETYLDGKGVYGGVNDPRMGSLDDKEDPGHFGHIELARPCYHLGYLKETLMVLRCVCFHCSRLMADPSDYRVQAAQKLKSQRRLEAMHALCRTQKRCEFATKEELDAAILEGGDPEQASYGCGALQPQFRKRNAQSIEVEFSADDEHVPGASCGVLVVAFESRASSRRRRRVDGVERPSSRRRVDGARRDAVGAPVVERTRRRRAERPIVENTRRLRDAGASRGNRRDARRSPSKQRRLRRPQADPERAQGARGAAERVRPRRETARPGPATRAARVAPTHRITGAAAPRPSQCATRRLEPAQ